MKNNNKISMIFYLITCLFFSFLAEAQEQVVIKGSATTTTYETTMERNVRNGIQGILANLGNSGLGEIVLIPFALVEMSSGNTTSQDFTITYTQEMMHMVASERVSDKIRSGTMILRFNPEGTQLNMKIIVPGQNPIIMRVPRGNTIASSYTQNLLTPAPVSNVEINGFDTGKYNFHTEGDIVLNDVIIDQNPVKLKKVDEGSVWLAPDAPGIGLMRGFYLNLRLGGYDLAGAEKAGIMALMDRLLERGMPIKAKETMTVSWYGQVNDDYLFKTFTETNIQSVIVEPLNEELVSGSSNSPGNSDASAPNLASVPGANAQDKSSTKPANEECDCSCEAYAKFVKLAEQNKKGKKSKKKTDQQLMQEMDLNCMQKCMMTWTKCMTVKN